MSTLTPLQSITDFQLDPTLRSGQGCDSHIRVIGDRYEVATESPDGPPAGFSACGRAATWRVTFGGWALGDSDDEGSALRLKCNECAETALEFFGPSTVQLRPL